MHKTENSSRSSQVLMQFITEMVFKIKLLVKRVYRQVF